MTVECFLTALEGGWYTTQPSQVDRFRQYRLTGEVRGSFAGDDSIFGIESTRGTPAVMQVRAVTRPTERKRGGRWRVRFFRNSLSEAVERTGATENRTALAFHEAGHSIAGAVLGLRPLKATTVPSIRGKGLQLGCVTFPEQLVGEMGAIVGAAGPLAEFMSVGGDFRLDGTDAIAVADYVGEDQSRLSDVLKTTSNLLADRWRDVQKLATRLLLEWTVDLEEAPS